MAETRKSKFKGWQRVLMILIPYFAVMVLFEFLAFLLLGLESLDPALGLTPFQEMVTALFVLAGTALLVGLFRKWVDRESFVSLGFPFKNRGQDVLSGLLAGPVIMALGFASLRLMGEIRVETVAFHAGSLLLSLLVFVFVGIGEELLMRGYVLNNLMLSMNRYVALVVASLIFAAMHLLNPHFSLITFFTIFFSGILLGMSYLFTRNLWFPIALHFSWNFFQGTIFGFNVSGRDDYSLIEQSRSRDTVLNGGPFGFEGSILSIGLILASVYLVWRHYSRMDDMGEAAGDPKTPSMP